MNFVFGSHQAKQSDWQPLKNVPYEEKQGYLELASRIGQ